MSTTNEPPASADRLRQALMESRQRWRDFGTMAADIAFEVDHEGRLRFVVPETVLGLAAESLIGRRAVDVFAGVGDGVADPFAALTGTRQRRVWVRGPDGEELCLALTAIGISDEAGEWAGYRCVAADVTSQARRELEAAAALRRADVLDHILGRIRQEVLAPKIMSALLTSLRRALGGEGTAVLDIAEGSTLATVLHAEGDGLDRLLPDLRRVLREDDGPPRTFVFGSGSEVIACQASTRFGHRAALIAWGKPETRIWDADDRQLLGSITALVRMVLEHEAIQRELARQARTDPLTGLLNRRAFLDEAKRRIDRLEQEGLPGTLMFVDLDRLKLLNDRFGHEVGDAALSLTSAILRRIVRPADLVARLGGDEFALWLDGFDELTAAERAEHLRLSFPKETAHLTEGQEFGLTMSIGIACRQPGDGEELDDLIQRADHAMYEVKRSGRGHWRVSHPERVR